MPDLDELVEECELLQDLWDLDLDDLDLDDLDLEDLELEEEEDDDEEEEELPLCLFERVQAAEVYVSWLGMHEVSFNVITDEPKGGQRMAHQYWSIEW